MPKPITKTPWATTYQDQAVTFPDNSPGLAPNKTQAPLSIQDSGVLYHEPLASNWLNFQLNETYQWIDYFEEVTDALAPITTPPPAGFTNTTYVSLDALTSKISYVLSAQAEGVSETVGPTGSGATNIWTALDDLPLDTVYIKIKVSSQVIGSDADSLDVAAAEVIGGSPLTNRIQTFRINDVTPTFVNWTYGEVSEHEVRVGANNVFEMNWDIKFATTPTFNSSVYLLGYGREV